ncbi:hypothetical protein H1P_4020008 [Hyella patelloides LEGE 07179]|uniref:Uncharacterized protein n=1 Tax=Hyella patelloides LEGE 07179 TaxID=945734 RepID=A0A563VXI6_9CYAN|nr:hypothetical protein [Hyella patelloides]VEP16097.1 hypothetical protein H1P_4020008 [Hyella patelloides LEGE 07179]
MKINPIKTGNFSPLSLKDKVRVIDPDENPSEWAVFQIADLRNNRSSINYLGRKTTLRTFLG